MVPSTFVSQPVRELSEVPRNTHHSWIIWKRDPAILLTRNGTESVVKRLPVQRSLGTNELMGEFQGFRDFFFSAPESSKKTWQEGSCYNSFLERYLISEPAKHSTYHHQRKLKTNIPFIYCWKRPLESAGKASSTPSKRWEPASRSKWAVFPECRMVCCSRSNPCDLSH